MSELTARYGPGSDLRVIACPRPFSVDRIDVTVQAGGSIAQIMRERLGLDPDVMFARVFIDDRLVEKAHWERVKPKAGHVLTVRVVPAGGGSGKNILRIVAVIAVVVIAAATGNYVAGLSGVQALGPGVAAAIGAGTTAAVSIVAMLGVNALLPPPATDPRGAQ
ncbi:hypothetical protein [Candidatus Nitrospira bockiana]